MTPRNAAVLSIALFFGLTMRVCAQLGTINHDSYDAYGQNIEYDTARHKLYGTGFHYWNGVDVNSIWQWHDDQFSTVDGGLLNSLSYKDLELHDGVVYLSGTFEGWVDGYDIDHLARWDGTEWQASGEPNGMTYLFNTGDELWCTGSFDSIGTVAMTRPARFNGTTWEAFEGSMGAGASPLCGALFQGEYYFGGNYTTPFVLTEDIVKWDGTSWVSVGGGIPDAAYGQVNTMVVYQGKLMVGGIFGSFGNPGYHSMSWDGNEWTPFFPELVTPVGGQVKHMEVIDGKLYQTGRFRFAGPNNLHYAVLVYDGEQLCGIGSMPADADVGQAFDICGNADSIFFNTDTRVLSGDSVNYYAVWPVANGPDTCVTIPTSMREQKIPDRLSAYPNPAAAEITIELPTKTEGPVDVVIMDALGREVMRYRSQRSKPNRITLDIHALATGSYVGRVTGGARGYFKFMKR